MRNFQKNLEISEIIVIFAPRKKLKLCLASFCGKGQRELESKRIYVYKEIKVRCRAFVGIDE